MNEHTHDTDMYGEPLPEPCPKCGHKSLAMGYGLMGGGIGAYRFCTRDDCDHFDKTLDEGEAWHKAADAAIRAVAEKEAKAASGRLL